ncbi:tubulin-like doman-containing protein [Dyadobacter diqingensis]|uniref:tubulin-like doman-containing protein n=1 Tax=Dyadobacter diqingensis TaxID=2938121 RepID=UPI0020C1B76D|nr:tubulin-like doman-containing protein [Dyadobacter diqingensis]
MATPTILIGIGSSGMYILEHVQRFYYETYGKNKPAHVEYLFIETNKDNHVGITPVHNEIHKVYVSLAEIEKMIQGIRTYNDAPWLPPTELVLETGMGAGGLRSCGRLALWGANTEGDNWHKVVSAISDAYRRVSSHTVSGGGRKPTVFVTGTFAGGTCSGMFIDMGYLIRSIVQEITELYGLFLIPGNPSARMNGYEVRYANTFQAFQELAYYNTEDVVYKEKWPSKQEVSFKEPPYELVQFISQNDKQGRIVANIDGLYKLAGLYLFMNIVSKEVGNMEVGFRAKRMERFGDAKSNNHINHYGTFGISAIQFPKDQIEEFTACQLSKDLLKRWIDDRHYFLNGNQRDINPADIKNAMSYNWDSIITDAFKKLNVSGSRDLQRDLATEAERINEKNLTKDPVDYIRELFSSNSGTNFYGVVKSNINAAISVIIDRIHDQVETELNETESFYYIVQMLEGYISAIEATLNYWVTSGIKSDPGAWESLLTSEAEHALQNLYKGVQEQDNVLTDRLRTIFEMMKMHLIAKSIQEVMNYLRTTEDRVPLTSSEGKELPMKRMVNFYIKHINDAIGKSDDKEVKIFTFLTRQKHIEDDVKDKGVPIEKIFRRGTFEEDWGQVYTLYMQRKGDRRSRKELEEYVANTGEPSPLTNLWSDFKKNQNDLHYRLYSGCLKAYRSLLGRQDNVQAFLAYDVAQYVNDNPGRGKEMAERAVQPMLNVKENFMSDSASLPRFITGADEQSIKGVINAMKGNTQDSFTEFDDSKDRILAIEDLKNVMVFYVERGKFQYSFTPPIFDLTYIDQMREVYENPPYNSGDSRVSWQQKRNAYKIDPSKIDFKRQKDRNDAPKSEDRPSEV